MEWRGGRENRSLTAGPLSEKQRWDLERPKRDSQVGNREPEYPLTQSPIERIVRNTSSSRLFFRRRLPGTEDVNDSIQFDDLKIYTQRHNEETSDCVETHLSASFGIFGK